MNINKSIGTFTIPMIPDSNQLPIEIVIKQILWVVISVLEKEFTLDKFSLPIYCQKKWTSYKNLRKKVKNNWKYRKKALETIFEGFVNLIQRLYKHKLHSHRYAHFLEFIFNLTNGVSTIMNHAGNEGGVGFAGYEGIG